MRPLFFYHFSIRPRRVDRFISRAPSLSPSSSSPTSALSPPAPPFSASSPPVLPLRASPPLPALFLLPLYLPLYPTNPRPPWMLAHRRSCRESSSSCRALLPRLDLRASSCGRLPRPCPWLAGPRPSHHRPRRRGVGSAAPGCGFAHPGPRWLHPRRFFFGEVWKRRSR